MKAFTRATAIAAPLEGTNTDTDQIIPARFLKFDRSEGYGRFLFYDRRLNQDGSEIATFPLNQPAFRAARILVADHNFGCGSSREGAVYALIDHGILAVIAPSFGDIFFSNSLKNGLLPVILPETDVTALRHALASGGASEVGIDLEASEVTLPDGTVRPFSIDPFWRECILRGLDEISLTLSHLDRIEHFEATHLTENPWLAGRPVAPEPPNRSKT